MRTVIVSVLLVLLLAALAPWSLLAQERGTERRDPAQRDLTEYRLRVDDQVQIVVYKQANLSQIYAVPANGEVSFPPIGKLNLLDRTVFEVEEQVASRLKNEKFLSDPIVNCIVQSYSPRTVFLIGAIVGTQNLPVHRNVRLLELLAMSGSLGANTADYSRARIRRTAKDGRPYWINVNVDDILEKNDEVQNVVIFEGDVIWLPQLQSATPAAAEWVYVLGKVNVPGRHPVIEGRTGFTFTKLIALAGDFAQFAERSDVVVIRKTQTGPVRIPVDFDKIIDGEAPDIEIEPDDLIYVPESFF